MDTIYLLTMKSIENDTGDVRQHELYFNAMCAVEEFLRNHIVKMQVGEDDEIYPQFKLEKVFVHGGSTK